jgi:Sulfotransferase family
MPFPYPTEYSNFLSRLLLRRSVEEQFLIPLRPLPAAFEAFMKWYERRVLKIDVEHIAIDRPIFLIGLPRSGTTILQDTLCSHPELAYVTNAMNEFPTCFCAAEDLRKRLGLDFKAERYLSDSLEVRPGSANEGLAILARWAGVDLYSLQYQELRTEDFPPQKIAEGLNLIKKIIWCFGSGPHRLFNKNPGLLPYMLMLKDIFPDCKIIHLIRDPRLCANSMVKLCRLNQAQEVRTRETLGCADHRRDLFLPYPRLPTLAGYVEKFGSDSIYTAAHLWNDAVSFVGQHQNEMPFFKVVRYEDILANPQVEILKILDFCELPEVEDLGAPFWTAIKKIGVIHHTNAYGNYDLIEFICRDNMRQYGYA